VTWIARRRPRWKPATAIPLFSAVIVGLAVLVAIPGVIATHAVWGVERRERQAVGAALDLAGAAPDARIMSIDAAGYRYHTGRGGVVSPNDPIETIRDVAEAYRIEWLVIERDDAVSALAPIFHGESRPNWVGPRLVGIPGPGGATSVVVHPVCQSPVDPRCAVTAAVGS
jgi:hypothetical protein